MAASRGRRRERRLVALDIDGTIIDHHGTLAPAVQEAIGDLMANGIRVVIATGRTIIGTLPVLESLDITGGYAVCSNGAVTVRIDPSRKKGYAVLDQVTFDPAPALTLLRDTLPHASVAVEELGKGWKLTRAFPDGELGGRQRIVSWEELIGKPTTRVSIRDPKATPEDFLSAVESVGLHGVSYAVGFSAWLDLTPEGVSKASALEQLRRRLRVEPPNTVAVGDQRNDIEMLSWAARGVAMGQAPDEVKAAAAEVTGTVDEDGLVPVLRSLL